METTFTLDCKPTSQARARHTVINGFHRAYKDTNQQRNEVELDSLIREFKPDLPSDKAIVITIRVYLPIPKSISKKKYEVLKEEKTPVTKKPDLDNYIKNILDCMTRAGFWRDDSQIASINSFKVYSEKPRWVITLREVDAD